MNLEELKRAGICFDFCPDAVVPEIPYTEDVLFALRLTDEQKYYDFCVANHRTYVVNVGLVIAAVGYAIFGAERYDEVEARKIIARAIIELCPEEAKCLFKSAFVEAKEIVGEAVPPKTASRATTSSRPAAARGVGQRRGGWTTPTSSTSRAGTATRTTCSVYGRQEIRVFGKYCRPLFLFLFCPSP